MQLVKKSGRVEEFDINKVKNSLAAASDEIRQPLDEGNLNVIVGDLMAILEGKQSVTSSQITVILVGLLYTRGLRGIGDSMLNYKRNKR